MTFFAYEFACACEAGLKLIGADEGRPEWAGNSRQWQRYGELIRWFETCGVMAWVSPRF